MNAAEKAGLKAQLMAVSSQVGALGSLAQSGASMPVVTPMGPAAAPGLLQIGAAVSNQSAQIQQLVSLIGKIVDSLKRGELRFSGDKPITGQLGES